MRRTLFIGTFLSELNGSYGVTEKLVVYLNSPQLSFELVSKSKSKGKRLFEIIIASLIGNYDQMHIDTFSGQAFVMAEVSSYIAYLRGKRVILTFHGGMLPEFYQKFPSRVKKVLKRAHRMQTPSLYLKVFFARHSIYLDYIPNSIDIAKFPFSRQNRIAHSILWVRAFGYPYNPRLAVETLYELLKVYPDTTLTMIGPDKGLLAETIKLIETLKVNSSIFIIGPVPNDHLYKYYQSHQVYINTTSYESFGLAVIEAAACGLPVVSTKVGEVPLLYKEGEDMLMIDDFDPKSFTKEILQVFNSESLADSLSINARKIAEKFDWRYVKQLWIDVLTS